MEKFKAKLKKNSKDVKENSETMMYNVYVEIPDDYKKYGDFSDFIFDTSTEISKIRNKYNVTSIINSIPLNTLGSMLIKFEGYAINKNIPNTYEYEMLHLGEITQKYRFLPFKDSSSLLFHMTPKQALEARHCVYNIASKNRNLHLYKKYKNSSWKYKLREIPPYNEIRGLPHVMQISLRLKKSYRTRNNFMRLSRDVCKYLTCKIMMYRHWITHIYKNGEIIIYISFYPNKLHVKPGIFDSIEKQIEKVIKDGKVNCTIKNILRSVSI